MSKDGEKGIGIKLDCFEPDEKVMEFLKDRNNKESNPGKSNNAEDDGIEELLSNTNEGPAADTGPPEVTIVRRDDWSKIEPPEKYLEYTEPLQYVLMTHTGTNSCTKSEDCIRIIRTIQRNQIALGFSDIIYNFLIGGDGKVYEGRGWSWESAWIPKYDEENGKALKIAHIGYYGDHSKKKLDPKEVKLRCDLLETGMYKEYVLWNAVMIVDVNEPDSGIL